VKGKKERKKGRKKERCAVRREGGGSNWYAGRTDTEFDVGYI
jgi:hypothetical protein